MRDYSAVEIISVGDELLSGATLDSNAARIAGALEAIGLRVVRKATVGDDGRAIAEAVGAALARTGAAITTGGLGPTPDDVTRDGVAAAFGRRLVFRDDLWQSLVQRWAHRGRIPETNRAQAEAPEGALVFPNPRGTAPAIAVEDERLGLCVLLPGPPSEVEALLQGAVVPYLARRTAAGGRRPFRRLLRTTGIAESAIAEQVGTTLADLPLELAYLPEVDGVDLRLTAWAAAEAEIGAALEAGTARLRALLGPHIYAEGPRDLAECVGALLRERGLSVATAESCTAGLIAKRLTDFPGSSDYFCGGIIAYDDRAKVELLGVEPATLRRHGAVSEATVRQMAEGACRRCGVPAAIAVTGVAGPGGGTVEKPVGTVWLAACLSGATVAVRRHYLGARDMVRARAAQGGLDLLRRTLQGLAV
jgi:nicotinamide-nucleotide amidase